MIQVQTILQLALGIIQTAVGFGTQAIQAWQTNDQAALDDLETKARAAADALKPEGV